MIILWITIRKSRNIQQQSELARLGHKRRFNLLSRIFSFILSPNARVTKFLEEKEVIIRIITLHSLPCHPVPEGQESSILSAALLTEVEDTRPDGESPASRQCIGAITVAWLLSRAEIKRTIF